MNSTQFPVVIVALAVAGSTSGGSARPMPSASPSSGAAAASQALVQLHTSMSGEFKGQRLEDAVRYIAEVSGAQLDPLWLDEQNTAGLDKDREVNLTFRGLSALRVLERVLERASDGAPGDTCTWQLTSDGRVQVGPRSRLNVYRRVEVYDVSDLLVNVPDFLDAPRLDLQSALQNNGAGQAPIRTLNSNTENRGPGGTEPKTLDQKAEELRRLITDLVEPDQWIDAGGSGGSIRSYRGTFIVNAPDYIHRQINGYPFMRPRDRVSEGSRR